MAAVNSLLLQEKRERDAAYALESFARYLYADKPDLFDNFYQAKRLLELADRRFRDGGNESLFDACSQSDKEACWAFKLHPRINAVLNPRGMEMLPIHKDGFVFQTMENCSDILLGPKDLYSLCLCLSVLQQHRCIYKLVLDVSVVARYHSAAFWKLLRLNTTRLDAVELRGLVSTPDRFSLHPLLCGAVGLSELILVDFTLTPLVIEQLCDLLDRNKGVRVLALRNIVLDTTVGWLTGVPESTGSEESDVGAEYASSEGSGESVAAPAGPVAGELSQEDTSSSDTSSFSEGCGDEDSVEADPESAGQATSTEPHAEVIRDWAPLFRRLEHYASLTELEISGRRAAVHSSLSDLASVLLTNVTLKRLTVQVCLPKGGLLADCLALAKAIGQNKGLESLSFASSNFGSDAKPAMDALRAALEENVTLLKLSMADCGLSCSNMLLLVGCLERNTTLEQLHIDAFHDQDLLRKLHDTCKLDRVEFFHKPACGDVRRRRALEKGEPAGEMNFLFTRTEDFEPMFAVLSRSCEAVHDLSIEGNVPITEKAAQLLANIILKCSVLESVTLLFPARALPVVIMLEALGALETLSSLVVGGGWQLTDRAAHAFDRMLRSSTSLTELTVVQPNRTGFEDLKRHLRLGMQKNALVTKLRLLYDLDRKEARDYEIMRMLQRNRIVEKRLADMAARVRGDAGSLSATPNFDVEYYTTRLGLTSANPDFAGLQAKLEMSKKLRQEVVDLTGRFNKMLSK